MSAFILLTFAIVPIASLPVEKNPSGSSIQVSIFDYKVPKTQSELLMSFPDEITDDEKLDEDPSKEDLPVLVEVDESEHYSSVSERYEFKNKNEWDLLAWILSNLSKEDENPLNDLKNSKPVININLIIHDKNLAGKHFHLCENSSEEDSESEEDAEEEDNDSEEDADEEDVESDDDPVRNRIEKDNLNNGTVPTKPYNSEEINTTQSLEFEENESSTYAFENHSTLVIDMNKTHDLMINIQCGVIYVAVISTLSLALIIIHLLKKKILHLLKNKLYSGITNFIKHSKSYDVKSISNNQELCGSWHKQMT